MFFGLLAKYISFLSACNETRIFSTDFKEVLTCQISWKSFPWQPTDRHDKARRGIL